MVSWPLRKNRDKLPDSGLPKFQIVRIDRETGKALVHRDGTGNKPELVDLGGVSNVIMDSFEKAQEDGMEFHARMNIQNTPGGLGVVGLDPFSLSEEKAPEPRPRTSERE